MSGDFSSSAKIVNPVKCIEKPWDLWVSEIGHSSPQHDDETTVFAAPAEVEGKGGASRRLPLPLAESAPYKPPGRGAARARYRRAGLNRLKYHSMSLHGLFPQMDNLNAAVCHMCGVTVKCSAAYRHLLESHTNVDPIRPPPPPAPTVKLKPVPSRSRHKKEAVLPPPPLDIPVKMETSPIHTANASLSRIVLPQSELQYLDEASASSGVSGEVQVCVETGELPVVSIQDTDELPLGENITDDIFAIMNSEGIQTADDITNSAEWKNIIRDIGNMQDINFSQPTDPVPSQELYPSVDASSLSGYSLTDADLSSLQFAPTTSPMLSGGLDGAALAAQALKPAPPAAAAAPSAKSRKSGKSKFNVREYDPNKHCGVVTADNPKPCTRSLTCKAHALSLRRTVEGRVKPFDTLLAEHRAARDAPPAPAAALAAAPPATLAAPLPVDTSIDLSAFNGLSAEQQVNDIYASLLSVEEEADPGLASRISSLLGQTLPPEGFLLPDDEVPVLSLASPPPSLPAPAPAPAPAPQPPPPPPLLASDVCWYQSCPRPLALCTFNAAHAGGAVTLGKRFATVRSNIKSSLSRSQCKATAGGSNSFYFGQNALSLSKTVHMNNASKSNKPEVRKLVVTCSATGGGGGGAACKEQTYGELYGGERHTLNGHVSRRGSVHAKRPPPAMLDLGFVLDPLLTDEKC